MQHLENPDSASVDGHEPNNPPDHHHHHHQQLPSSKSPSETTATASTDSRASKRIRLNLACNQCRKRKVRCDAETPKCRNCWLRDEPCETTDPRRPGFGPGIVRRWATKDGLLPGQTNPAATHRNHAFVSKHALPATADAMSSVESDSVASGRRRESWISEDLHLPHSANVTEADAGPKAGPDPEKDPDVVVNRDEGSQRVKYLGASSLQCLTVFLDMYLKRRGIQPIAPCFKGGMRYAEEFDLPLFTTLPDLPGFHEAQAHFDMFFSTIWPLIPVVDHATILAEFHRLYAKQRSHPEGLMKAVCTPDLPVLACIFTILAIGSNDPGYLAAAYSLYAHLVASPYLPSVQALVLLGFALRSKSKDGQCWQLIGQAIRIAHSIGLHKHIIQDSSPGTTLSLEARVWWSAYALERLMTLETGRPCALTEREINQITANGGGGDDNDGSDAGHEDDALALFCHWVALARIMGQISEHLATPNTTITSTTRLDQRLQEWAATAGLPFALTSNKNSHSHNNTNSKRPSHAIAPMHAFLALQYHHAQIALFFRAAVAATAASSHCLVAAARATAHLVLELADHEEEEQQQEEEEARDEVVGDLPGRHVVLVAPTQPFLAGVVLGLHVLRHPGKRTNRSDLALLVGMTEYIEGLYRSVGQSREFVEGCVRLRTGVGDAVTRWDEERRESAVAGSRLDLQRLQQDQQTQAAAPMLFDQPDEGLTLEELWSSISADFVMGEPMDFSSHL